MYARQRKCKYKSNKHKRSVRDNAEGTTLSLVYGSIQRRFIAGIYCSPTVTHLQRGAILSRKYCTVKMIFPKTTPKNISCWRIFSSTTDETICHSVGGADEVWFLLVVVVVDAHGVNCVI